MVSKAVGNAVVRNRVERRLRHLVAAATAPALTAAPAGTAIVIRALPAAATSPERVTVDFERAWRRAWSREAGGVRA